MKKTIRAINHYFFPDEDEGMHWSDYVWFYGTYGFMGIVLVFLLFINLISFWG